MATFVPNQKLPAAQLNSSFAAKANQSDLLTVASTAAAAVQAVNVIANGTAPSAGALAGSDVFTLSRGAGSLSTTLTTIAQGALQTVTSFSQAGAGAIARTAQDKLRESVSVKDFGAVGDGATDDTAAFNAALASFGNLAGICTAPPGKYLINAADLVIPRNVTLRGPVTNTGEQRIAPYKNKYDQTGAVLLLGGTRTISMGDATNLEGFYILNLALNGALPFPDAPTNNAAVAAFSGTAITANGADVKVTNTWIGGFATGFSSGTWERTKLDWVQIDCTNGVFIDSSSDIARLHNVHVWPFLSTHNSWTTGATAARSGSAFKINTRFDGGELLSCFSYGWAIGFDVSANETVTLVNCFADGASVGGQIGFKFSGNADLIEMIGGGSSGVDTGVYVNITPGATAGNVTINGTRFWGNANHIKSDNHKVLNVLGCMLRDTSSSPFEGITITGTVTGATNVANCWFDSLSIPWNVASGTPTNLLSTSNNRFTNGGADTFGNRKTDSGQAGATWVNELYSGDSNAVVRRIRKARGTQSAPAIVNVSDNVQQDISMAWDGTQWVTAGQYRVQVTGTPGVSSMPSAYVWSTNGGSGVTDRLQLTAAGNLIPFTDNAYNLGSAGNRYGTVFAATGTINTSDANAKTDVENSVLGLDFVNSLRPVSYKFKIGGIKIAHQIYRDAEGNECHPEADGSIPAEIVTEATPGARRHWGLIAQEVKAATDAAGVDFAGWTIENPKDMTGLQGLRYDQFVAPLIKAVQELTARVIALEGKVR